jgi:hypothetical protein
MALSQGADTAAAAAIAATLKKRGRPPKVISIGRKELHPQHHQDQGASSNPAPKKTKVQEAQPDAAVEEAVSSLTAENIAEHDKPAGSLEFSQASAQHPPRSLPPWSEASSSQGRPSDEKRIVDWDSLMSGGLRRVSSSERLELWRYLLDCRPSPEHSPPQSTVRSGNAAPSSTARDPRALSEWMDRILWLSDPENWSPRVPTEASPAPGEGARDEKAADEPSTEEDEDDDDDDEGSQEGDDSSKVEVDEEED